MVLNKSSVSPLRTCLAVGIALSFYAGTASAACLTDTVESSALSAYAVTISFADAFDRSDSTTLDNGWQEIQGDLLIQNKELRNAAGLGGSSVAIQPYAGDQQSASAVFASTSNNSIPVLGLVLRYESPQSYYALYRLAGGSSLLRIVAVTSGQEVVLGQASVPNPSENSLFKLSAAADGCSLSLTLEGVKTVTATDCRIPSGKVGVILGTRTTNAALKVSHRADDFSAEITTSGPPPQTLLLAASLASDPPPQSVQAGSQGITFANIILNTNGSAEDISVSSVQLNLETDTGSTSPDTCQLFDGTTVLVTGPNIVNPVGDGVSTFTLDGALVVPMQTQRVLKVQCNVPASAAAGDSMEWRLSSANSIDARGATSGQGAVLQIQDSADNQNKVTVPPAGGGTGIIDLTQLRSVLRGNEISLGPDLGEQKPPLLPHTAVNFEGQSPPNTAWLTVHDQAVFGDGTVSADMIDSEINGEQCGGVAALVTEGASGRAIVARSCDAKGTDTLRLGVLNTATGVVTSLVNTNLFGRIDTYGGSVPPANCDHNRGQLDYHMYCQWVKTSLTVTTNQNGTVTFTATSWLRGTGLKNDPSRNEPTSPDLTLIGTATWTGARPANVATTGKIGLVGTATQGWERISMANLRVD